MALLGNYLTIRVRQHSSATAMAVIAETTSVDAQFTAEALESTSQADALNAGFKGGLNKINVSGDYLYASDGEQFDALFAIANAGSKVEVDIWRSNAIIFTCDGVFSSLNVAGGLSDTLATGSYSMELDAQDNFPGLELLINGDFVSWTEPGAPDDYPDNFVLNSNDAENYVSDSSSSAQFITDAQQMNIRQSVGSVVSGDYYLISGTCTSFSGAGMRIYLQGSGSNVTVSQTGDFNGVVLATGTNFFMEPLGAGDITISDVSLQKLL